MSHADWPDEPPNGPISDWVSRHPISPGAARRRLGAELRRIREAVGLTGKQAGAVIERSAATISRFESAKTAAHCPRRFEVSALLDAYRTRNSDIVTQEKKRELEFLAMEGKKEQWFDPFKDLTTGAMIADHQIRYMEFESDASAIMTYEPDLVPGLLQTHDYARAVARIYFANRSLADHDRFAEFRMTRQTVLQTKASPPRLSLLVNEGALRRFFAGGAIHRAQLQKLIEAIRNEAGSTRVHLIRSSVATPAALGGPFVILRFPEDSEEEALVYLETRSGADYLTAPDDVERFSRYFVDLRDAALRAEDAVTLIQSILDELDHDPDEGDLGATGPQETT